jgi:hypothetical protein
MVEDDDLEIIYQTSWGLLFYSIAHISFYRLLDLWLIASLWICFIGTVIIPHALPLITSLNGPLILIYPALT